MRCPDRSGERSRRSTSPAVLPRREWLAGAVSVISLAGCRSQEDAETSAARRRRTDVPLRVVWVGSDADAEILTRAWSSISEQPLDVRVVEPPRPIADSSSDQSAEPPELNVNSDLFAKASAADVLIYPIAMMSQLVSQKSVMPLLNQSSNADTPANIGEEGENVFASEDRTTIPVALRIATTFSSERLATPMGGYLPAVLLGEESSGVSLSDWDSYEAFVKSSDGKCCEPTAPTWAGAMYLWRLASSLTATWLFERESLRPLFTEPEYVAVLEQMRRAVKASVDAESGRTPGEIYTAVANGKLRGGIGFPQRNRAFATDDADTGETGGPITLASLPTGSSSRRAEQTQLGLRLDPSRGMVDPFMLVGSMASSCRQTAAADTFINWLAGGEGSEPLYRGIGEFVDTKTVPSESSNDPFENYRSWLSKQLSDASFVPTLQLIGATEYYAALDKAVRECVHGDQPAKDACQEITDRWARLHRKFDLPSQQRNWRRAQGIS